MGQIWKENKVIPVTLVRVEPNTVSEIRTKKRDGYDAVQLSLGKKKRETKTKKVSDLVVGSMVSAEAFQEGEKVIVTGTSKGQGFQGVVKRHGFHGGPKTHGQKNRHRAPGSIGSTAPQRVWPGRRMAGHMGDVRITIKNLTVAGIDKEHNIIFLKGAVPGAIGGLIQIRSKE